MENRGKKLALLVLPLIIPFILQLFFIFKSKTEDVKRFAKQSLYLQCTVFGLLLITFIFALLTTYIPSPVWLVMIFLVASSISSIIFDVWCIAVALIILQGIVTILRGKEWDIPVVKKWVK